MSRLCYVGLGSNLRTPIRQIRLALNALKKLPKTTRHDHTPLIQTRPLSPEYQPYYCNTVVALQTHASPYQLLRYCQHLEKKQGRIRKKRWGPRTLDIDLLEYGNLRLHTTRLTLPHPGIPHRSFVSAPLCDLKSRTMRFHHQK